MSQALTVLMTNMALSGRSGTEIQTRNIALELLRQGHKPLVYSPVLGPIATELREASIPVVTDLNNIAQPIHLVHGHHLPTTLIAVARFPESPAIFVCHDFTAWHDSPPLLPSIRRYVAVDEAVYDRLTLESGIPEDKVRILLNAADINRFVPGASLPRKPKRALAFAKNRGHIAAISAACADRGIELDVIGQAVGRIVDAPERLIPDYDLVFTSALSAMEAMASGRAVVVCDGRGLAGMCDVQRFAAWRRLNFGLRTLRQPLTQETIGAEIDRYDARQAAEVTAKLRSEGGLAAYVDQLTSLYEEVLEEHRLAPHSVHDLSRAIGTQLQDSDANSEGLPWLRERQLLLEKIDELLYGALCAPLDKFLEFGSGETRRWWQKIRGFSIPEDWGMWTDGSMAIALFRVGKSCGLHAEFVVHPFVPDKKRELSVGVTVNGLLLDTWHFRGPDSIAPRTRRLRIPKEIVGEDGAIWLAFAIKDTRSPKQLGLSEDSRLLGLGLRGLTLRACD
jgi:glycosyl transferase family 4